MGPDEQRGARARERGPKCAKAEAAGTSGDATDMGGAGAGARGAKWAGALRGNASCAALGVLWLVAVHLLTRWAFRAQSTGGHGGFRANVAARRRWGESWHVRQRDVDAEVVGEDGADGGGDRAQTLTPSARAAEDRGDSYQALLAMRAKADGLDGSAENLPQLRKRDVDAASLSFMRGVGYDSLVADVNRDWLYNGRRNPFKGGWSGGVNPRRLRDEGQTAEYKTLVEGVEARKQEASRRRQRWLDLQANLKRSAYLQLKPFLLRQNKRSDLEKSAKKEARRESAGRRAELLARVADAALGPDELSNGGHIVARHRHAVVVATDTQPA